MAVQFVRTAVTAAAAALVFAGAAAAQSGNTHTMTVQLPNGGVAQIRYAGDVAPQVIVSYTPAILVPVDGAPARSSSPDTLAITTSPRSSMSS